MLGWRHAHVPLVPVLINQQVVTSNHTHLGMSIQVSGLEPQTIGIAAVVEVLPGHVVPSRLADPEIGGAGDAQSPGREDAHAQVASGHILEQLRGAVGGAIVHDDPFEILESLLQDPGDSPVGIGLPVVHGSHHADSRIHAGRWGDGLRLACTGWRGPTGRGRWSVCCRRMGTSRRPRITPAWWAWERPTSTAMITHTTFLSSQVRGSIVVSIVARSTRANRRSSCGRL